jgi:hypothetical protein
MEEKKGAHMDLVRNSEGNRPLGRPTHLCDDNIHMDLQEAGWETWLGFIWPRIGTGGRLW